MEAATKVFCEKVLADDRIKHFFEGINMNRLQSKQKNFLTLAFGGPKRYRGRPMA